MSSKKYIVISPHFGDKMYLVGGIREVSRSDDAAKLIKAGLIEPLKEKPSPKKKTSGKK